MTTMPAGWETRRASAFGRGYGKCLMITSLKVALNYAHRGWKILPVYAVKDGECACSKGKDCKRPGKHPITEHGVKDATSDAKLIKKWWQKSRLMPFGEGVATGLRTVVGETLAKHGSFSAHNAAASLSPASGRL